MKEVPKTNGDMLRVTAENLNEFLVQVADHLEALEAELVRLQSRVEELEASNGNNTEAQ